MTGGKKRLLTELSNSNFVDVERFGVNYEVPKIGKTNVESRYTRRASQFSKRVGKNSGRLVKREIRWNANNYLARY